VYSCCVPASGVVMAAVVLSLLPCVLIRPPLAAALRESTIEHYRREPQEYVGKFLATFKEFPPSQKPGSFSIDRALAALQSGAQGGSR
jgi:hypothetical protein